MFINTCNVDNNITSWQYNIDYCLSCSRTELSAQHRPHLALPRPLVLGGHAPDDQPALVVPRLGVGPDPAVLPGPASAHCIDGPIRGPPQTDTRSTGPGTSSQ